MDSHRLRDNFALVARHGDDVAAYFYADLFERAPALRTMFPASMDRQREMLLGALSHIVSVVDDTDALVPYVRDLGRRHQDYGVKPEQYPAVGASLLATLQHFSGQEWNESIEKDWTAAYMVVVQVMQEAAGDAG